MPIYALSYSFFKIACSILGFSIILISEGYLVKLNFNGKKFLYVTKKPYLYMVFREPLFVTY